MQSNSSLIDSNINNILKLNHEPDSVPINVVQEPVRITVDEWAAKAKDKTECYRILAHEHGAYLPHIDCITVWHLRDLAGGRKKCIKEHEVKHLNVP